MPARRALRDRASAPTVWLVAGLGLALAVHAGLGLLAARLSLHRPLPEPEIVTLDIHIERQMVEARAAPVAAVASPSPPPSALAPEAARPAPAAVPPPAPAAAASSLAAAGTAVALPASGPAASLLTPPDVGTVTAAGPLAAAAPTPVPTTEQAMSEPVVAGSRIASPVVALSDPRLETASPPGLATASTAAAASVQAGEASPAKAEPRLADAVRSQEPTPALAGSPPAWITAAAEASTPPPTRDGPLAPAATAATAATLSAAPAADVPTPASAAQTTARAPLPGSAVGHVPPATVPPSGITAPRRDRPVAAAVSAAPSGTVAKPALGSIAPPSAAPAAVPPPVQEAALRVLDAPAVAARLRELTAGLGCGRVDIAVDPDLRARVRTHAGDGLDLAALRQDLEASGASSLELAIEAMPEPLCPVLDLVEAGPTTSVAPGIGFNRPDGVFHGGDVAVFTIEVPATIERGLLYVAFVDPTGEVVHLLPSRTRRDAFVRGGERVRLGVERAEHRPGVTTMYEVVPPYGPALLLAIVTTVPLPGAVYAEVRPLGAYIEALRPPLEAARSLGPVLVAWRMVETRAP